MASRSQCLNRALKAVERVALRRENHFEGLIVVVAAYFADCHIKSRSREIAGSNPRRESYLRCEGSWGGWFRIADFHSSSVDCCGRHARFC